MSRGRLWRITWGAGFANELLGAYPLDAAVAFSQPREGSEWVQGPSGVESAWIVGHDQVLSGQWRWITAAQWDGATGVRAFLESARAKAVFRFYPDRIGAPSLFYTCYLANPDVTPEQESDFTRRLTLVMRERDGNPFTGY